MTTHRIASATEEHSTITIARGSWGDVATLLPERDSRRRVAILTQPPVARLAADVADGLRAAGLEVFTRELPDREQAKTLAVVEQSCGWLSDHGVSRHDTVVAIGGGALTDVAGFVAAVYLRGVEVAYLPSTLLGAVDAGIGGKTGVNVGGKNLAGAFRHPTLVAIDPAVLDRLPEALVREGGAEALKAGLIGDVDLVELYEAHGLAAPINEVVERAVAVKVAVVAADYREHGGRGVLNYGHTIGHAVETLTGMPHGHAVAVGMVAAGAAAARHGFTEADRQQAVIERLGLPTSAPGVDPSAVRALIAKDKKRQSDATRMVLLDGIGTPRVTDVSDATVTAALAAVGIG